MSTSPSPFRPGSIFYDQPSPPVQPRPHPLEPTIDKDKDNKDRLSATNLTSMGATLASPPPSPSRNSIFDQPWATTPGPNICTGRSLTTVPSPADSSALQSPPSAKIENHDSISISISNSTGDSISGTSLKVSSDGRQSRIMAYTEDQLTSTKDHVKRSSLLNTLQSPVHFACPSPSLLSPASNLQLPPPTLTIRSKSTQTSSPYNPLSIGSSFSLHLDRSKANLLGQGRNADVYKAMVQPRAQSNAIQSITCRDLLQQGEPLANFSPFVCAAKCLHSDPDSQAVAWAEADILKTLHQSQARHPGQAHIVDIIGLYDQVSGVGYCAAANDVPPPLLTEHAGSLDKDWIVLLEYCQHGAIWDWIRLHPDRVGFEQWLEWALQLAQALDYIHQRGLVHHDVKPHNIMLDSMLDAKLSDFGASRYIWRTDGMDSDIISPPDTYMTKGLEDGLGRGTPPYSAPEIFTTGGYGQAVDIYSLGVSLYVIGLTAQEPFHKMKSVMEMIVWVKKGGFWLWEDQGWVHDRGPIPKTTPSSRTSSSAALAQAPQGIASSANSSPRKSHSLQPKPGPFSKSAVATSTLSPINTQLPLNVDAHMASPRASLECTHFHDSAGPMASPTSGSHFQQGHPPWLSSNQTESSTPISPYPLPSPMTQTPHSPSARKEDHRKSGEVVMRFLNGEITPASVINLLKDMCQADPGKRPTAKQVLLRLQDMKEAHGKDMDLKA